MQTAATVQNSDPPLFVEIFAGRGSLSRAMKQSGFSVLSIDHESEGALVPMVTLDLTSSSGQQILWDVLASPSLLGVHMGLPCGTASLAREKPVSATLQAQGAPNPPPLRSATHPLGLPGLSPYHQAKVTSANILYPLAVDILVFCVDNNIVISIENPANSWLWAALVKLTTQHSERAAKAFNWLEKVIFHACCHGSTRRKATGWLGTPTVYSCLAETCQNDHDHEPWGIRWNAGSWIFDTSAEAAYPMLLAQRVAACMVKVAHARKLSLQPPLRIHDLSTAALGKQSKKHPPLIPEYHHFVNQKPGTPIAPGSKALAPHLGGESREEPELTEMSGKYTKVGVYHTPKQFLSRASAVCHPMDTTDHLEKVTSFALECNLKYPAELVRVERKKNLLMARLMVAKTQQQEKRLHESLPESLQKVLEGKRLLVWKQLLEKFEFDDMEVYNFMTEGVRLVGQHGTPACFPEKLKPASLTQQDLENSAVWRRRAIVGKLRNQEDPSHIEHLEQTAAEELEMGFVEGPFASEQEVTDYFGHGNWMVIRRFVLVQGAELKLRPIDDCLEAQLNKGFTSTSYLKLQDIDYVVGLSLKIAEAVMSGGQRHGSGNWQGKCLDLSKAYKQLAVHPSHRHLAVIFYHDAQNQPKFYIANALMFGSTAAVYSFNRVSRSLWFLFNKMLLIPCGYFYDDYPMFSPTELAQDADGCARELLDILGWRHARTGPKGQPFANAFNVLGCTLDLTHLAGGQIVTENKPGRVNRLVEHFARIRANGKMSLHEAQVLHGLLRYACGFFAGRFLHQVCAEIMNFGTRGIHGQTSKLADFCDYAVDVLRKSVPRSLKVFAERRPILVFTDGAWEDGEAGIGAVIIDTASGSKWVLSDKVPNSLIDAWRHLVGEQLICQIELYAMVAVRWMYKDLMRDRRTLWWVDNEAARFSTIRGLSPSVTMRTLVREFYNRDLSHPMFSWIERVPSYSNPADGPSRSSPEEIMALLGVNTCSPFLHEPELLAKLCKN